MLQGMGLGLGGRRRVGSCEVLGRSLSLGVEVIFLEQIRMNDLRS